MSHARLGPSNPRWIHCPGSVREEAKYPDISGEAAIDGTGSHLLLEMCIEEDRRADSFIGEIIGVNHEDKPQGWEVKQDRADRVQQCLDYIEQRVQWCRKTYPKCPMSVEAESKANPGGYFGRDDWWGTVDITIIVTNPLGGLYYVEVIDYKDGRGWVSETDNSQLLSYLGGKVRAFVGTPPDLMEPFRPERIKTCRVTIVQPKTGAPRYQDVTMQYVMDKLVEYNNAASLTDNPDAPLKAGKWCQWCKHNPKRGGYCTTAVEQSMATVESMDLTIGSELLTADVSTLSEEQLAKLADTKDPVAAAYEKIEEEIQARIERGEHVPGYAMLPGNSSYVWNDSEDNVIKALKGRRLKLEDIYIKKMMSPAQMKKHPKLTDTQKKGISEKFVSEKVGKLKLKKVAVKPKETKDMFAQVAAPVSFL